MFGFSLSKLLVLGIAIAVVWYGFKYISRMQRINEGERRPGERSMGERLRRSMKGKDAPTSAGGVEDTEQCPTCGSFVPVEGGSSCGKARCPY